MKTNYRDYDLNYGYRNYSGFKKLSNQEKTKFLSDWHTAALHPILLCEQNWILFFDNMSENDFFQTLSKQHYTINIYEQIENINLKIQKCKERLELYKKSKNFSKHRKIDKKITKLLDDKTNLLDEKKKLEIGKLIYIAIDANAISEKYINKIIKLCNDLYKRGFREIKIMAASSDKSIDSKIEYYYDLDQLSFLSKLEDQLEFLSKNNKNSCQLKFCELINLPLNFKEYNQLWNLKDVKKANEFVEETRLTIENSKLSPLEAALYIYMKIANSFQYNEVKEFQDGEHTIIGALSDKKIITCAGFASMFKIAIDVLQSKKLSAEFISTENSCYGHCFNLVKIIDKHYKIKGFYSADLVCDAKCTEDSSALGFSGFLRTFYDALYERDNISFITNPKSRIDQTCINFDESMREITGQKRSVTNLKLKEKIDKQIIDNKIFATGYDDISTPIDYNTIISAYINMMNKTGQQLDFEHLVTLIDQTCIYTLLFASEKCKSSWLKLLNIDTIKAKFDNNNKNLPPKSEMQIYLDKKNIKPLLDCSYPDDEMAMTIYQSEDREKYFSESYSEVLEKVKNTIDQLNNYNQK